MAIIAERQLFDFEVEVSRLAKDPLVKKTTNLFLAEKKIPGRFGEKPKCRLENQNLHINDNFTYPLGELMSRLENGDTLRFWLNPTMQVNWEWRRKKQLVLFRGFHNGLIPFHAGNRDQWFTIRPPDKEEDSGWVWLDIDRVTKQVTTKKSIEAGSHLFRTLTCTPFCTPNRTMTVLATTNDEAFHQLALSTFVEKPSTVMS